MTLGVHGRVYGPTMTVLTPPASAALAGVSVLIVDDDVQIVELASLVIGAAGGTSYEAGNAAEARALLVAHPVDVIVTDLVMPGTTGRAFLDSLTVSHPALPAVAMSGIPEQGVSAALRRNVVATLDKPFTSAQLLAAVALAAGRP
jgi:two-component system, cell cycle sensor histidine kinase and response regulator CckA